MITIKTERELELMRVAGRAVATILQEVAQMAAPGMSTGEIDKYAEKRCKELNVIPAFKGYKGFPACMCISVNSEVVHGIPSAKRILKEGDIVGFDFGVIHQGWFGDSAKTVMIGKVSDVARDLVTRTEQSLYKGIEQCVPGNRVFDIGHAVQKYVEAFGYGVVREFVGHGIGRALHEDPQIPNYGAKGKGPLLKPGMVIAIEPMINLGSPAVRVLDDEWTAVTEDGSLSAHFEHTVAITEKGPEILTQVLN
jgi:methionyl aminopeptidase